MRCDLEVGFGWERRRRTAEEEVVAVVAEVEAVLRDELGLRACSSSSLSSILTSILLAFLLSIAVLWRKKGWC